MKYFKSKLIFWSLIKVFCLLSLLLGGCLSREKNIGRINTPSQDLKPVERARTEDAPQNFRKTTENETSLNRSNQPEELGQEQSRAKTGSSVIPQGSSMTPQESIKGNLERNLQVRPLDSSKQDVIVNHTYDVLDEFGEASFKVSGSNIFSFSNLPNSPISFDEKKLLTTLIHTRAYFYSHAYQDSKIRRHGLLGTKGISVSDILKTLDFMIAILHEDLDKGSTTRLKDPDFLNKHFRVIHWNPFDLENPSQEKLRITKYAIFTHTGSRVKTPIYDTPLYRLNPKRKSKQIYSKYSKQEVLAGVYEAGGEAAGQALPLVYLTRDGLEEALLQGTILVRFDDGKSSYFNVDINNQITYVKGVPQRDQKRYWYFKEVDSIKGYGYQSHAKIPINPGVTFAGDILNIGLGKIVMLDTHINGEKILKVGVIADTGGAFSPNLYQLDYLAGVFSSREQFEAYSRQYSAYADAYFLVLRQ